RNGVVSRLRSARAPRVEAVAAVLLRGRDEHAARAEARPAKRGEHVSAVASVAFRVIDAAARPEIRALQVS
ncbi:MAG: hypothetical protein ACLP01_25045, partial [Solirubrobacteraceae bacterium]